ncbi:MAG: prepilin-type N-terminal cleavage/methylation domain-containing protein [Acidobacteria bacterium]|nr:prepilin-type N-terminal cleavage/methylation domain-containing protein [Acidobacteriota bacterium]
MRQTQRRVHQTGRRQIQDGFTLLELLVSMTVVALLATTILFGWRIAAGAWGRANQLVEDQRRVVAVHQVLTTQMAEMMPLAPSTRLGSTGVFFQGEGQTARFLSRYSLVYRSRSGLYRIEYQIADASDGVHQLLVNEVPASSSNDIASLLTGTEQRPEGMLLRFAPFERRSQTRVLLDDLTEAHFEYYRPAGPLRAGEWVREWINQGNELPRAMAIRLTARSVADRLQPVSIVAGIENYSRIRR